MPYIVGLASARLWTQGGIAVPPEVYDALASSEVLNIEQEQKR